MSLLPDVLAALLDGVITAGAQNSSCPSRCVWDNAGYSSLLGLIGPTLINPARYSEINQLWVADSPNLLIPLALVGWSVFE